MNKKSKHKQTNKQTKKQQKTTKQKQPNIEKKTSNY